MSEGIIEQLVPTFVHQTELERANAKIAKLEAKLGRASKRIGELVEQNKRTPFDRLKLMDNVHATTYLFGSEITMTQGQFMASSVISQALAEMLDGVPIADKRVLLKAAGAGLLYGAAKL